MASIEEAATRLQQMRQPENPPEEPSAEVELVADNTEPLEQVDSQVEEPIGSQTENETQTAEPSEAPEDETFELEADQFAHLLNLKDDQIDIDDDGVKFRAKVGDEYKQVTLEQLINSYQGDANLTRRSQEIANLEKQHKQKLAEMDNQSQQFAQQITNVLENIRNVWINPYSEQEMKELRADDPAEFAARREEISDREKTFESWVNQALSSIQSHQQTSQQEMHQQYAQYLQHENEQTLKLIPNWKDVEKDAFSHALSKGFNENELGQIADHRLLGLIYDSMMYHKGKSNVEKKLAKKIPKIVKAGAKQPKQGQMEKTQAARQQLKKSGKVEDAVALLKARRR